MCGSDAALPRAHWFACLQGGGTVHAQHCHNLMNGILNLNHGISGVKSLVMSLRSDPEQLTLVMVAFPRLQSCQLYLSPEDATDKCFFLISVPVEVPGEVNAKIRLTAFIYILKGNHCF